MRTSAPRTRRALPFSRAAAAVAQLRTNLEALAAAGKLPGGEQALGQLLSRLDAAAGATSGATVGASVMAGSAVNSGVGASAADEIDCSGGIYVRDAYLHLILVNVSSNMASSTGTGAGGGMCAVNLPSGGLQMERVTIANNTAGETGYGYGGRLFYSGGETPAAGALALNNVRLQSNRASGSARGYGGGAFVTQAPGGTFALTMLSGNYATYRG